MHLRLKAGVPMIAALLLLTGCGKAEKQADELALSLRTTYLSMSQFSAEVSVTADYGDSAYEYQLLAEGNQLGGSLTVLEPEEVEGAVISWQDGKTALTYDGASVETGELSPDGLSPTDGIPLIFQAVRSGGITDATLEQWEEGEVLVLTIDNPNVLESGQSVITVWANREDFSLLRAEIAWEGTTVLQVEFEEFQFA